MNPQVLELAEHLLKLHWKLSLAESCTGGLIASMCTDLAGSSEWFDRGFVTYSNEAKTDMLGVPEELIASQGAVSGLVAESMALGALYRSHAKASIAVTGIAGPSGGSNEKPVGTVWIAWCVDTRVSKELCRFSGDRQQVRHLTAQHAIAKMVAILAKTHSIQ